jgi:hypothetical protein
MDAVSGAPTARVDGKGDAFPRPFGPASAPIYAMGTLGSRWQTRVCGHETAVGVPSTAVAEPAVGEAELGLQELVPRAQNASPQALSGTTRQKGRGLGWSPTRTRDRLRETQARGAWSRAQRQGSCESRGQKRGTSWATLAQPQPTGTLPNSPDQIAPEGRRAIRGGPDKCCRPLPGEQRRLSNSWDRRRSWPPRHLALQQTGRPVCVSLRGPPPQVFAEWLPYGYKI